jgi:hypothetical protein
MNEVLHSSHDPYVWCTMNSVKRNVTELNNAAKSNENVHYHCISFSLLCTWFIYDVHIILLWLNQLGWEASHAACTVTFTG